MKIAQLTIITWDELPTEDDIKLILEKSGFAKESFLHLKSLNEVTVEVTYNEDAVEDAVTSDHCSEVLSEKLLDWCGGQSHFVMH